MERIVSSLGRIQETFVQGPLLILLLGIHIYFTLKLGVIQKKIPQGIRLSIKKAGAGAFSALATSLAATIGTGNIVGISTAIAIGGPGAVFWCWVTGILGIATCYAECYLSLKYRISVAEKEFVGGSMYILEYRLKQKNTAVFFSIATILVSMGMGCSVQAHAISASITEQIDISEEMIGILLMCLTGIIILGGAKTIGKMCTWLVPFMSLLYMGGCLVLLWMNRKELGETCVYILNSAFGWKPVMGGMVGAMGVNTLQKSRMKSAQIGILRGLFTNEAGLGSIPMAAASSCMKTPEQQALVSMTGPFWDTVVMCAVTGVVIVSCMLRSPKMYVDYIEKGQIDRLCFLAFSNFSFAGEKILSISLTLFAFATILGWNYYGLCAVKYLGNRTIVYQVCYLLACYLGCVLSLEIVWELSDFFNVMMLIPNLICLWILRKEVKIV